MCVVLQALAAAAVTVEGRLRTALRAVAMRVRLRASKRELVSVFTSLTNIVLPDELVGVSQDDVSRPRENLPWCERDRVSCWNAPNYGPPADSRLRVALSDAVVCASAGMDAWDVLFALWAVAWLGLPADDDLYEALSAAAQRVARDMTAEQVCLTLRSLADLHLPASNVLCAALGTAAERVSPGMVGNHVFIALHAVAKLAATQLTPRVEQTLPASVLAAMEPTNMCGHSVAQALEAVAVQQGPVQSELRQKLLQAVQRDFGTMSSDDLTTTLWALRRLGWEIEGELRCKLRMLLASKL
jgi:hypothetical protein